MEEGLIPTHAQPTGRPAPASPRTADAERDRPVVELDHVTKRFDGRVAVDDLVLSIREGEFFSLLGPSGCGKTTTLRMIAGFEEPTAGTIRLAGVDVSRVPPHKRNVNTVFQHYALFPHLSVWDNVAYGPRSARVDRSAGRGEVKRRVGEMLEVVRLTDFAKRKPGQLSGGQQQRVALARALVNYPSALLLDEPLGALDLRLRHAMQLELKRIQRELGVTFVYVTHDQEEALTMSDRIAVLNDGAVEQVGSPADVYDDPATVFVAGFIGQTNSWDATLTRRDGDHAELVALATTLRVRVGARTVPTGDRVTLVVRPERIGVTVVAPPGDAATVPATVTDSSFQGPVVRLSLAAADGSPIVAHLAAQIDVPPLRPGDRVFASWTPEAALLLPMADDVLATNEGPAIA